MDATDWTRPDAYAGGEEDALVAAVADLAARHMLRAFDRIIAPIDRAAITTRSRAVRADLDEADAAMTAAIATHDALRRILVSEEVLPLEGVLHDVCRAVGLSVDPSLPPPAIQLDADAAATWMRSSAAWAIGAAVVEMADEVARGRSLRVDARFVDGHLAIAVAGAPGGRGRRRSRRGRTSRNPARDGGGAQRPGLLDRLAGLLPARVVRDDHGPASGVAIVIEARPRDIPAGDEA